MSDERRRSGCPKCNGRMEHLPNALIVYGGLRNRKSSAIACIECGFVEFYLKDPKKFKKDHG